MSQLPSLGVVAVVGAGVAGLAAARHLKTFGYDVVVLEGRVRFIYLFNCSCFVLLLFVNA